MTATNSEETALGTENPGSSPGTPQAAAVVDAVEKEFGIDGSRLRDVIRAVQRRLSQISKPATGAAIGGTSPEAEFTVEWTHDIGMADREASALIDEEAVTGLTPADAPAIVAPCVRAKPKISYRFREPLRFETVGLTIKALNEP